MTEGELNQILAKNCIPTEMGDISDRSLPFSGSVNSTMAGHRLSVTPLIRMVILFIPRY